MNSKLALFGGSPIRTRLFPAYNTIGEEEKRAALKVLDSGNLSQFLGAWTQDFYGGPSVRKFEEEWSEKFGVKHSISVNSNTSGLFASIGACGIGPGDEVIVSPYTMSASAIAPLLYGAVPVFADIDEQTFCLNPKSICEKITPRTKAILIVHIMGHPADMDEILKIAKEHHLRVIEDCAQSPMGKYKGKYVGTLGDIGVFSLNYHKHIHTGEGGMIITNDSELAERLQLVRNHGETVIEAKGTIGFDQVVGFNYRMTELEAAIGIEQLRKLPRLLEERLENVKFLNRHLQGMPGLTLQPAVSGGSVHTYYVSPIKFDSQKIGVHRNEFVKAMKAEVPSAVLRETAPLIGAGYVKPLYLQPIYQKKAGKCGMNCPRFEGSVNYAPGICPVAERMHFQELITHEFMRPGMGQEDLMDVVRAFHKVFEHRDELKSI